MRARLYPFIMGATRAKKNTDLFRNCFATGNALTCRITVYKVANFMIDTRIPGWDGALRTGLG
jgi:hypothetical protein